MKWYERFSQRISSLFHSQSVLVTAHALSRLDPDHIEVENVRSILNVSYSAALQVCQNAVRDGLFLPKIAIVCPDDSIARVINPLDEMPSSVPCWNDGERLLMDTNDLEKREFYVLNER